MYETNYTLAIDHSRAYFIVFLDFWEFFYEFHRFEIQNSNQFCCAVKFQFVGLVKRLIQWDLRELVQWDLQRLVQ